VWVAERKVARFDLAKQACEKLSGLTKSRSIISYIAQVRVFFA
jgi:hypothetical protein